MPSCNYKKDISSPHFTYHSTSPPLTRRHILQKNISNQPNQQQQLFNSTERGAGTSSGHVSSAYNSLSNPQSVGSNGYYSNNTSIVRVNLVNGNSKSLRYDSQTTVERVTQVLAAGLNIDTISYGRLALRLATFPYGQPVQNNECLWLHPHLTIQNVIQLYFIGYQSHNHLRFELRMRFVPSDLQEMFQTETDAFLYLFEQLRTDYLAQVAWKIETNLAVEIGGLLVRKRFSHLTSSNIEKKLDFELIDKEGGLKFYFPEVLVLNEKPKHLKKTILNAIKKFVKLTEIECIFKFMSFMSKLARFDTEIFRISLGLGWSNPAEIFVGSKNDLSYKTEALSNPVKMCDLKSITEISVKRLEKSSEKAYLSFKVSGNSNPFIITVSTLDIAFNLAHLLDGFQSLIIQQGSIWPVKNVWLRMLNKKEHEAMITQLNDSPIPLRVRAIPLETNSSSSSSSPVPVRKEDLQIERKRVILKELIGTGQFGSVFKGDFTDDYKNNHSVAIKVCKSNTEQKDVQNFIAEAYLMHNFRHPHIIRLIGICEDNPVWIVMELAPLGELRQYLIRQKFTIDLYTQLMFAYQLSTALKYLHDNKYLHRDCAARNVLVVSARCVKLADFGLSRDLAGGEDYYTAGHGKLPIKWMAPESINFRKFSAPSDVYMLSVTIWEILSYGQKPWQNIRNHEVIGRLENGERPEIPVGCPLTVYDLLHDMWNYESEKRPTMRDVKSDLQAFLNQLEQGSSLHKLQRTAKRVMSIDRCTNVRNNSLEDVKRNNCQEQFKVSMPLKLDASKVANDFLIKALEEQRLQCEEDDKWLQEVENEGFYKKEEKDNDSGKNSDTSNNGYQFDRDNDMIYKTVMHLIHCITNLTKNYRKSLSNDDFVRFVKDITNALKNLFHESTKGLALLGKPEKQAVETVETLLGDNMREMAKSMASVVEPIFHDKLTVENHRLEVLKVTHMLAINSKYFLETFDNARLKANLARKQNTDNYLYKDKSGIIQQISFC
uniref:Non-specific protein-tyrosine kinase n=1 Tax=Rhabditophanes sp. KR3021 TaxID=114890 RepID=A0AC35TT12_9BILA